MSENISIEGSVAALTALENLLQPTKDLKAVFEHAKNIEAETRRLLAEQQQAEAKASQAKRLSAQYDKEIAEKQGEIERLAEQKSNLIDEGTQRAQQTQATVKRELEKMRLSAATQKKQFMRELTDLAATIEQKRKEIARLEENRRDLAGGAQQIEANAMAASETMNANKRSLEHDVANLQAQKLQLNSEVKRLQANMDDAKRYEAEKKKAEESTHRAKQELSAMEAQLSAKRADLTDLNQAIRLLKEEAAAYAQETGQLQAKKGQLQSEIKRLEREARA